MISATWIIMKAHFANCKFIKNVFPSPPPNPTTKLTLLTFQALGTLTLNPDPKYFLVYTEVTKLLNLKDLVDQIPDSFYPGL
jgi:hypothetical protein